MLFAFGSFVQSGEPESALDLNTEIACAYYKSAGVITQTEKLLAAQGIKVGRTRINSVIRTNPQILAWTKELYDEEYKQAIGNRLEGVTSEGIQRDNEIYLKLSAKNKMRWDRELGKEVPSKLKCELFAEFAKWTSIEFINRNLVYHRFKDGLHSKAPFMAKDDSQHKTEILNFNERLPEGGYDVLREHIGRLKENERFRNLPAVEQGGNGATP